MSTTLHPTLGVNSPLDRPAFKVADLSLADWGRKEIRLAEHEMPGLMAIREEQKGKFPLLRQPQTTAAPARSQVWMSGRCSLPLWAPSQKGRAWLRPQVQKA